jgi:hypothetical protein
MKKTFAYLVLFVFSVYFSFITGKILGELDGDKTGDHPLHEEEPS